MRPDVGRLSQAAGSLRVPLIQGQDNTDKTQAGGSNGSFIHAHLNDGQNNGHWQGRLYTGGANSNGCGNHDNGSIHRKSSRTSTGSSQNDAPCSALGADVSLGTPPSQFPPLEKKGGGGGTSGGSVGSMGSRLGLPPSSISQGSLTGTGLPPRGRASTANLGDLSGLTHPLLSPDLNRYRASRKDISKETLSPNTLKAMMDGGQITRCNSLPTMRDQTSDLETQHVLHPVWGNRTYTFVRGDEEALPSILGPMLHSAVKSTSCRTTRTTQAFRLLKRLPFQGARQVQHKLKIHRVHHLREVYALYLRDLFHTLVNMKVKSLFFLFALCYLVAITCLAIGFWHINYRCDLNIEHFEEAFALAVETWLTIGYGISDPPGPYLKQCTSGIVLLTVQGMAGLFINAFLVSLVITHVTSGAFRGCTMMFSQKAAMREVNGRLFLTFQVCEMRSTQLLEAHVRAYVIREPICPEEVPVNAPQAFEMRLLRPDDDNGALMLPVFPSVIVHEIDQSSPLAPMTTLDDPMRGRHWARPGMREADARNGGRDAVWCRTCGEAFACEEMLEAHQIYQAEQDALSGATIRPHKAPPPQLDSSPHPFASTFVPGQGDSESSENCHPIDRHTTWRSTIEDFLDDRWFEILVVVEGVDTMTAATVQARHSYIGEDIIWDHTFAPMLSIDPVQGAVIDFTKIDDLVPAPPE